jgi:hypothetical protein
MSTRVVEQVRALALRAQREMSTERRGAALCDRIDGTDMTGQHGLAVALQIVRPVSPQYIGESERGEPSATGRP